MANNTGTYILVNNDGYRVVCGSRVEDLFHKRMTNIFRILLYRVPLFKNYSEAFSYANEVEDANNTGRKVLIIDRFKNMSIEEMR